MVVEAVLEEEGDEHDKVPVAEEGEEKDIHHYSGFPVLAWMNIQQVAEPNG